MAAAAAAQRDAEDAAGQARMLALGGLLVGAVGLVLGGLALARSRRPAAPAARPDVALTGAGKVVGHSDARAVGGWPHSLS